MKKQVYIGLPKNASFDQYKAFFNSKYDNSGTDAPDLPDKEWRALYKKWKRKVNGLDG